jgi:hypothetical protein
MSINASWVIGLFLVVTAFLVLGSYPAFGACREKLKQLYRKCAKATCGDNDENVSGWLYLWPLTLSLISVKIVSGLLGVLPPFSREEWAIANDPMASAYHPLLRPLLLFELVGRTGLLYIASVMTIDFFNRPQRLPKLVIGFLVANLLFLITEQIFSREIMSELKQLSPYLPSPWKPFRSYEFALALGSCVVWIPYFLSSKRVKALFK